MNGSDELVGLTLDDRYRLDALLGEGGMGRVYRATQLAVSRNVAVKVLHKKFARDSTVASRFLREAEVVSELTHPNIVTLVDYGTDRENGLVYLVMEMVDGLDLTSLLQEYRCGPSLGIEILDQLCAALTEPHREEIIHRDLKPDNVMVQTVTDGSVQTKILDFGIARVVRAQTRLTQTDTPCGTPSYMSPEQVRSREIDERTDLYALGVIMFELLTGRRPFSGGTGFEVMLGHIQRDPPRIRDLNSAVSEDFAALVADLLEKKREDRPEDVNAVRRRIERLRETGEYERIRIDPDLSVQEALEPWLEEDDGSVEESVSTNPRDEESLEAVRDRLETKLGNTKVGRPEVRSGVSVGTARSSIGPAETTVPSGESGDAEAGGAVDGDGGRAAGEIETRSPEPTDSQRAWALRGFFNRTRSTVAAAVLLVSGVTIGLVLSVGGWAEADSPTEHSAEGESEREAYAEREEPNDKATVDRAEARPSQKPPSVGVESPVGSPSEEGGEESSETDDPDEEEPSAEPEEVAEPGANDEDETGDSATGDSETGDSETGDEGSSVAAESEGSAPSAAGGSGSTRAQQERAGRSAREAGGRAADSRAPSPSTPSETEEGSSGEEESDEQGFQVLPVEP